MNIIIAIKLKLMRPFSLFIEYRLWNIILILHPLSSHTHPWLLRWKGMALKRIKKLMPRKFILRRRISCNMNLCMLVLSYFKCICCNGKVVGIKQNSILYYFEKNCKYFWKPTLISKTDWKKGFAHFNLSNNFNLFAVFYFAIWFICAF